MPEAPFDYGSNGYIGTWLCNENGVFNPIPTLNLVFSQSYADFVPGLTIRWSTVYNEWATKYRVTAYHGSSIVYQNTSTNDKTVSVMSGDISGYDKITIEVLEWSKGYRRARVEDIIIGIEQTYDKSSIYSYNCSMFVDSLSASLPKSEITFTLVNLNGEYNLDNPRSTQKYLMERQEVVVRYGYKLYDTIEWIYGGTYYLSGWDTPQNGIKASFTARDAFEFMSDIYDGVSSGTLYDIAIDAFEQSDIPKMENGSDRWVVSNTLSSITVPDGLDLTQYTIAEVLQYCANAARCILYQDRTGRIRIEPYTIIANDYSIDRFNSYSNSEVSLSKQLRSVDLNNGQYVLKVGKKGETQTVSNPFIPESESLKYTSWVANYLSNRRQYSGEFRADPRLDPIDAVLNENEYATNTVLITTIKYTYNGAFRGSFEGRGIDSAQAVFRYSGDLFAISGFTIPTA